MPRRVSRSAFTLVELLVVIGIIAILISILMPALSRVRDQGNRIKCMSHLRNVLAGMIMYSAENKQSLPWTNWGGNFKKGANDINGTAGWLYDFPQWDQWQPSRQDPDWAYLEGGMVFKYLKSREVFKCPLHTERTQSNGATEKYTSYLMNGVTCDYGAGFTYKVSRFQVMDIIIWETGESNLMDRMQVGPPFNDGSSFPTEWLSERHGAKGRNVVNGKVVGNGGASVGCVDGHVEWFSYKDYSEELDKPVNNRGRSRLYISPTLPNGGWRNRPPGV